MLRILFIVIHEYALWESGFNLDISHHGSHKHSSGSERNDYKVGATITNKRGYYIYPDFCDKYACKVLILTINQLGWLILWNQEIQESSNLEGRVSITQSEFAPEHV